MSKSPRVPKIAHVECIDLEHPSPGGVESLVVDMLSFSEINQGLIGVSKGWEIKKGIRQFSDISNGRRLDWFSLVGMPKRRVYPDSVRLIIGLLRHKRDIKSHQWYIAHRFEVGLTLRLLGLKYVQFVHNDSYGLLGPDSESFWRKYPRLFRFAEKAAIKSAEFVVAFNKAEASRLSLLNPRCFRSQSWFDDTTFKYESRVAQKESSPLKIVWVGRLESQKNPSLALDVAKVLLEKGFEFELQIIGSGSLLDELQFKVNESGLGPKVIFTGRKSRKEIASYMAQSNCHILTSHSEGSPVVLAEAAATGLASVVSTNGDPDNFVIDGLNGYHAQGNTPEQFVEAILKCVVLDKDVVANSAQERSRSALVPKIDALLRGLS